MIKLIVGLGNPGTKYENNRHNVGYKALDYFAKEKNLDFKLDLRFKAFITSFVDDTTLNKIILLKPVTYMNLSGEAVKLIVDYFKINLQDILIVHDDLDLDTGYIRLREDGSSGGHNGIKNIILNLHSQNFNRARIGISKDKSIPTNDYVLGNFKKDEAVLIDNAVYKTNDIINDFTKENNFKNIMSKYNIKK